MSRRLKTPQRLFALYLEIRPNNKCNRTMTSINLVCAPYAVRAPEKCYVLRLIVPQCRSTIGKDRFANAPKPNVQLLGACEMGAHTFACHRMNNGDNVIAQFY